MRIRSGAGQSVSLVAAALVLALTTSAGAAPGDLDTSFSGDGRIALPAAGAFVPRAVAVDPQDRIVVAGYQCTPAGTDATCLADGDASFRLARLTPDGGLDPEFGANGFVTTPIGSGRSQALDVVLLPDGGIVAGGVAKQAGGLDVMALARYTHSGALDPAFGDGGVVLAAVGRDFSSIGDIALGPGETILAAGQAVDAGGAPRMAVARFTASGALDTTFGTEGLTLGGSGVFGYALALGVGPGGAPLLAGVAGDSYSPETFRLSTLGLSPSGAPGAAFQERIGESSSYATSLAALPGGEWIAAGAATVADGRQAMASARLDATGRIGTPALVTTRDGAVANDVVVDRSGRPILVGQVADGAGYGFATAFGDALTVVEWPDYPVARATAGALQRSGRLVTVGLGCAGGGTGTTCAGGSTRLLVARQETAADRTAPAIRVAKLARRVDRAGLAGLRLRVSFSERAKLDAKLWGHRRGDGRRFVVCRVRRNVAASSFSVRLYPRRRALERVRSGRLRLAVRAADAAGNAATRKFTIRLR